MLKVSKDTIKPKFILFRRSTKFSNSYGPRNCFIHLKLTTINTTSEQLPVIIRTGMKLLALTSRSCRTADACVKRVMNEDVAVDAVKCFALRTLKKVFVGVVELSLAGETKGGLLFVENFDEICNREEVVI